MFQDVGRRFSEFVTGCYDVHFNKHKSLGDISFQTIGPRLLNTLTVDLNNSEEKP